MATPGHDLRCAHCGTAATKRRDASLPLVHCAECRFVDLDVAFCSQACYDAGIERHRTKNCVGEAKQRVFLDDPKSWKQFCTPACRVELVTPRLRVRPVEMGDNKRVFAIKQDPLVTRTQLYDSVPSENYAMFHFTRGYVSDLGKRTRSGEAQLIFELTRADWDKGRKKSKSKKKKAKKPADGEVEKGSAGKVEEAHEADAADPPEVALGSVEPEKPAQCRWCQIPTNSAQLGCSGCSWAFWCSQACKNADLLYAYGHAKSCEGRGGDPTRRVPAYAPATRAKLSMF
ncbi:hypothetical protein JCM10213_006079 [Rhodosporidiobolus nylandii]